MEDPLKRVHILLWSITKHGHHRQFLFLIGRYLKNLLLWNCLAKWTETCLIAPSVFSNVYFVYIPYIHLVVNIYYLVHKMNIMERKCQQRWPTIPLSLQITEHKSTIFADGNHSAGIGHVQICGGAKTVNEIPLFPFSAISRLSQLTSGHCWLILGSINMYLFYHCSSPFKSGHTYSTIQWNALNLLTCWESVSLSRVFYCHWGKKN